MEKTKITNIEQNFQNYWNKNKDEILCMFPFVDSKKIKNLVAIAFGEGALSVNLYYKHNINKRVK